VKPEADKPAADKSLKAVDIVWKKKEIKYDRETIREALGISFSYGYYPGVPFYLCNFFKNNSIVDCIRCIFPPVKKV